MRYADAITDEKAGRDGTCSICGAHTLVWLTLYWAFGDQTDQCGSCLRASLHNSRTAYMVLRNRYYFQEIEAVNKLEREVTKIINEFYETSYRSHRRR